MLIRKLIGIAIRLLGLATLTGCDSRSRVLSLARDADLDRYAGRWYLIANIPRFAENGNVGSFFDINFHAGRKLTDACATHPKSFDTPTKSCTLAGYVVPGTGNARWRESPFWPLYLSYLILYVDPGYQAALAATPNKAAAGSSPARPSSATPPANPCSAACGIRVTTSANSAAFRKPRHRLAMPASNEKHKRSMCGAAGSRARLDRRQVWPDVVLG